MFIVNLRCNFSLCLKIIQDPFLALELPFKKINWQVLERIISKWVTENCALSADHFKITFDESTIHFNYRCNYPISNIVSNKWPCNCLEYCCLDKECFIRDTYSTTKGLGSLNFELKFSHVTMQNSSFPLKFSSSVCIEQRKNMISECCHIVSSNLSHYIIRLGRINTDFNKCNN